MIQIRKDRLENNYYYHIYSRSIAKYIIFNDDSEFSRIVELFSLFQFANFDYEFSKFFRLTDKEKNGILTKLKEKNDKIVEIISYCIMPTHFHLILKQVSNDGISKYVSRSLNSYSRYFNTKHKRIGPLWSGRFKNVLVEDDEQLHHLTRYIHLNPTSAGLVEKPEDWMHSSYLEYIDKSGDKFSICDFREVIDIKPKSYVKFVNDQKGYQRKIGIIKSLIIEDYTG